MFYPSMYYRSIAGWFYIFMRQRTPLYRYRKIVSRKWVFLCLIVITSSLFVFSSIFCDFFYSHPQNCNRKEQVSQSEIFTGAILLWTNIEFTPFLTSFERTTNSFDLDTIKDQGIHSDRHLFQILSHSFLVLN